MSHDPEILEIKSILMGSLLEFTRIFFKKRTGRDFYISKPKSNISHFITVSRALTKCFNLETLNLMINIPPGWGKSELCKHFIAWAMAHNPDSNFLYISYAHELASKHTHGIKQIMEMPLYKSMFNVHIRRDSSAKDHFMTTEGGTVAAFGSSGPITGRDAGLPNLDRFSGAAVMDDMHKPDEVYSDTMRTKVINNYIDTISQRRRGLNVPFIFIGQRLHEDDLPAFLLNGADGKKWEPLIISAIDSAGNSVYPEKDPIENLMIEKEKMPYVFWSQKMQQPQPAGGGIFKPEWFYLTDDTPDMLATFITADTAETDKSYNDATVFSFWGVYKINNTDRLGLHWIDCVEIRVEPKDLEYEFESFLVECARFKVPPALAAIEKKSTGPSLISNIREKRIVRIVDIGRNSTKDMPASKVSRFLQMQPYIAEGKVSIYRYAKHTKMCLEHMAKITANDTHRFDDIADTVYDAIKIALIDKGTLLNINKENDYNPKIAQKIFSEQKRINDLRRKAYYGG